MNNDDAMAIVVMLVAGVIGLAMLAAYVWSIVWVYSDAERRGKPGCLVALLVAVISWPLSLLLWIVVRPVDER